MVGTRVAGEGLAIADSRSTKLAAWHSADKRVREEGGGGGAGCSTALESSPSWKHSLAFWSTGPSCLSQVLHVACLCITFLNLTPVYKGDAQ